VAFGTRVGGVTNRTGGDNGPGTYGYPSNPIYQPGIFDLTAGRPSRPWRTAELMRSLASRMHAWVRVLVAASVGGDKPCHVPTGTPVTGVTLGQCDTQPGYSERPLRGRRGGCVGATGGSTRVMPGVDARESTLCRASTQPRSKALPA
jgi:hypothetical protein